MINIPIESMYISEQNELDSFIVLPEFDFYSIDRSELTFEYIENVKKEIERLEEEQRQEQLRLKKIEEEKRKLELEKKRIASVTFDPYNLSEPSNLTGDEMYNLLKDTGLKDVSYTYIEAEKKYEVNAFFLVGLSALESGWGTSNRAVNDNNLTGYNIRSSSDNFSFNSRSESLMATAKLISEDYLNTNGRYYLGGNIWDVNQKYCPPVQGEEMSWADKIVSISNKLLNEYKSLNVK